MARRDVDLVIKARDEAKSTLTSVNNALKKFTENTRDVTKGATTADEYLKRLGVSFRDLQKSFGRLGARGQVEQQLNKITEEIRQQNDVIKRTKDSLSDYTLKFKETSSQTLRLVATQARLTEEMNDARVAVEQSGGAQYKFARNTEKAQITQRAFAREQTRLTTKIQKLQQQITQYEARLKTLQTQLSNTAIPATRLTSGLSKTEETLSRLRIQLSKTVNLRSNVSTLEKAQQAWAETTEAIRVSAKEQDRLEKEANKTTISLQQQNTALSQTRLAYDQTQKALHQTAEVMTLFDRKAQIGLLRNFREQQKLISNTRQAYQGLSQEATRMGAALRQIQQPTTQQTEAFTRFRMTARDAKTELLSQVHTLQQMRGILRESGGSAEQTAGKIARFEQALRKTGLSAQLFQKAVTDAKNAITGFAQSQEAVRKNQAGAAKAQRDLLLTFQQQKKQVSDARQAYRELSQEASRLGRALSNTQHPAERQIQLFAHFQKTARQTKAELLSQTYALQQMRHILRESGSSVEQTTDKVKRFQRILSDAKSSATRFSEAMASSDKAVAKFAKEQESARKAQEGLVQKFAEQRKLVSQTQLAYKRLSIETARMGKAQKNAQETTKSQTYAFTQLRSSLAKNRYAIKGQVELLRQLQAILTESGGSAEQTAGKIERFNRVLNRAKISGEKLRQEMVPMVNTINQYGNAAGRLIMGNRRATRSFLSFSEASRQSLSYIQRLRGQVLSLIAAYGGLFAVILALRNIVEAYQILEKAQNRVKAVFPGDAQRQAAEMDFIRRQADRLGISYGVLAQEYTKFAIATKNTNLEGQVTRNIFLQVASAARVQGATLDDLAGTFVALTQIVSKGTVSMEELRQQLGDRLPGALQILADAIDKPVDEMIDMISKGQLSSDTLKDFGEELDKRFGGQLLEVLNGFNVALGRFQNAVYNAFLTIGKRGAIQGFTNLLKEAVKTMKTADFQDFLAGIGAGLKVVANILTSVVRNWRAWTAVLAGLISLKLALILRNIAAALKLNTITIASLTGAFTRAGIAMRGFTFSLAAAATAARTLRAVLISLSASTLLGLGAAIAGAGLSYWLTEGTQATEIMIRHRETLDKIKNAYDATRGSVDKLKEKIKETGLTQITVQKQLSQAIEQQKSDYEEFNTLLENAIGVFDVYGRRAKTFLRGLLPFSAGEIEGTKVLLDDIQGVFGEFKEGIISTEEFRTKLDELLVKLKELHPENTQLVENLDTIGQQLVTSAGNVSDLRNALILAGWSAGDVDKALTGLKLKLPGKADISDVEKFEERFQELAEQVSGYAEAVKKAKQIEYFTKVRDDALKYAQTLDDIIAVMETYNKVIAEINEDTGAKSTLDQLNFEIKQQKLINAGKNREAYIEAGIRTILKDNADISAEDLQILKERLNEKYKLQQAEDEINRKRRKEERETQRRLRAAEATQERITEQQNQIRIQELINAGLDRQAFVENALRQARRENADISAEQLRLIEEQAKKLYDLRQDNRQDNREEKEQKKAIRKAEKEINDLLATRKKLQTLLNEQLSRGASEEALSKTRDQIGQINEQLQQAIDKTLTFLYSLDQTDPAITRIIAHVETLKLTGGEARDTIAETKEQLAKTFQSDFTNAARTFFDAIADGENTFASLTDAIRKFASDFLLKMSLMIAEALILKGILTALGFPTGNTDSGILALFSHSGGVAGLGGLYKRVPRSIFSQAVRLHSGGISGLQPNEIPAILQRGEEVLTRNDPRHILNGGIQKNTEVKVTPKIINAIDSASFIEEGLRTKQGQEAIMNFIQANRSSLRGTLGGP